MKRLLLILFLAVSARGQLPAGGTASAAQSSAAAGTPNAPAPDLPVDQENARKAKALLEQAIQALGGPAYLNLRDKETQGRGYSFYHGRPTSTGVLFWSFFEFPDKERDELTKERDVAEVYVG